MKKPPTPEEIKAFLEGERAYWAAHPHPPDESTPLPKKAPDNRADDLILGFILLLFAISIVAVIAIAASAWGL